MSSPRILDAASKTTAQLVKYLTRRASPYYNIRNVRLALAELELREVTLITKYAKYCGEEILAIAECDGEDVTDAASDNMKMAFFRTLAAWQLIQRPSPNIRVDNFDELVASTAHAMSIAQPRAN